MEGIKLPIFVTTAYLFFYVITPHLGIPYQITALMFAFSPFMVVWTVIRVLKDGKESEKKFEDYFYEDSEIRRNNVER